jgi:hypothetical protein
LIAENNQTITAGFNVSIVNKKRLVSGTGGKSTPNSKDKCCRNENVFSFHKEILVMKNIPTLFYRFSVTPGFIAIKIFKTLIVL